MIAMGPLRVGVLREVETYCKRRSGAAHIGRWVGLNEPGVLER
jgi:hypothetical protein